MQKKTLHTVLAALCALLIFEIGYMVGAGEQRKECRVLARSYIFPRHVFYPGRDFSGVRKEELPGCAQKKSFFVAAMALKETDQAKIITVNLPGVDKKDIKVEVNGKHLILQVKRNRKETLKSGSFYAEQLSASDFLQTIVLDDNAKTQQIRAEFNKDVLTVTIPKDKRSGKPSGKAFFVPVK
ncbi:MAG: Hsp20 family protein [Candidatus Omnitrophota bacterium]